MLQADNVSFAYVRPPRRPAAPTSAEATAGKEASGYAVVDRISLTIRDGSIVGLLGPNGSGKTTLLRLLSGTRRPTHGVVRLDGQPLDRLSRREVARRIAVVPQETELAFEYSVLEIVLMGRHPHLGLFELEGPGDVAIARDMLRATGTDHLEDRPFNTLSGGEKQRVVIAAALTQTTETLLLDEPTASLDLAYQLEIAALLTDLNHARRTTVAIATHDLNLAASICGELVLIKNGRVIAHGATDDVLTAAHVRALYDVDADVRRHDASGHVVVVPVARARK